MELGILCLLPMVTMIVVAITRKRQFDAMLSAIAVGFLLLNRLNPLTAFTQWLDTLYAMLANDGKMWIILICGFFGSVIALIEKSGGALGFTKLAERVATTRKRSLFMTWILGIIIFVDEYLNALAVGSAMRPITDRFKVSREYLAYIINSVGAGMCVLIPATSWSAFYAGLMEGNGMVPEGMNATAAYIHTIPYMFFPLVVCIIVPLGIMKILPLWGPMKSAEKRAMELGEVLPASSIGAVANDEESAVDPKKQRALNFLLPMVVITVATIILQDILYGVVIGLAVCFVLYIPQRLMSVKEYVDTSVEGFLGLGKILMMIILGFTMAFANQQLGVTDFVIANTLGLINAQTLPVICFLITAVLSFSMNSFWGISTLLFPILAPLAVGLSANPFIVSGAIISGCIFGTQTCMVGDIAFLTCASTKLSNADYFRTIFPMAIPPLIISAIGYVVVGFL